MQDRPPGGICATFWQMGALLPPPGARSERVNKDETVRARVEPGVKARFEDRAKAKGMTPAALLRQLVLSELGAGSDPLDLAESAIQGRIEVERATVRMPGFLQDAAKDRANLKGMSLSRWIAALVQSNLVKDPVLTDKELLAIRAMNRELAAIGRNINQIAKSLNSSIDGIERSRVGLDALEKVPAAIAVCRRVIRDLSRKSQQSWISDDE